MPAVTSKEERVECSDEVFGQIPVFYSLDGWPEPFHLLDWLDLICEPASNPLGKVGRDAPCLLLLIDGCEFRIDADLFITCWQMNIFRVCITRDGATFFNPLKAEFFRQVC